MSTRADDVKAAAEEAAGNKKKVAAYVSQLSGDSRRERQQAASVLAAIAKMDASAVAPHGMALVEALDLPEAQTRWEALDALSEICSTDARTCEKAIPGAESALFDENSGPLRLAAMRFLCRLGSTTENRSEKVWGLIDEGIQCYHGDLEFNEMLVALIEFSDGKLAPGVKKEFAARMKFDADNAKGTLGKRASQIQKNLKKRK